ncbi:MAG TPA: DUF6158 family protein, partial [Actinomycetota bacterium]|nr:DUF6158 family protein [Actinomycetota bacterium]
MPRRTKGVPPSELSDADLLRELRHMYETREDTFFNGSAQALRTHTDRMFELESAYAARHGEKVEPSPSRTRAGARTRAGQSVNGATPKKR